MAIPYYYNVTSNITSIEHLLEYFNNPTIKIVNLDGNPGLGKTKLINVFKDEISKKQSITINGVQYDNIIIEIIQSKGIDEIRELLNSYYNNYAYANTAIFFIKEEFQSLTVDALEFLKMYSDNQDARCANFFFLTTSNELKSTLSKNKTGQAVLSRTAIIPFHNPHVNFVTKYLKEQQLSEEQQKELLSVLVNTTSDYCLFSFRGIEAGVNYIKSQTITDVNELLDTISESELAIDVNVMSAVISIMKHCNAKLKAKTQNTTTNSTDYINNYYQVANLLDKITPDQFFIAYYNIVSKEKNKDRTNIQNITIYGNMMKTYNDIIGNNYNTVTQKAAFITAIYMVISKI